MLPKIVVFLFLFGSSFLFAESFSDFRNSQASSFQKYADERDNAFNSYLKAEWKAYNMHQGKKLYEKPKPKKIISVKPKKIQSLGPKIEIKIKKQKIKRKKHPIVTKKQKVILKKHDIYFNFFGSEIGIDIAKKIKTAHYYPQNQKGISNFFDKVASSNYQPLIKNLKHLRNKMQLNDWGTYLLVLRTSQNIFKDKDDAKLLSWFIFNKMGYAVKVGLAKNHIVLMHYSKKTIYSTPNYSFGKKKFYVISNYAKGGVGTLYSYKQNYPGADKPINLSLKKLPNFTHDTKNKILSFKEFNKQYNIKYNYNQNIIDFMATYPQADYDVFFNAPIEEQSYKSIANGLKKYVDGKKASDAMNFILHFVQKSFKYERDDQQFGREKVMFAEETLYYQKSDCEDRAILYSYLMKELFGVYVVGIKYKDHMATALYIPMSGDSVQKDSKRFIVADPTYINANIGQSMPKYRSLQPESFIIVKK